MKKFITTFIFGWLTLCTSPARADIVLGADVYKTFMDTSQELEMYAHDEYDMIAAVLGFDFNGVGIEGFYQFSNDTAKITRPSQINDPKLAIFNAKENGGFPRRHPVKTLSLQSN